MALMKWREPNQVKWQGMRPAHNGLEVLTYALASNATTIIYTVPAGKVLYLCHTVLRVSVAGPGVASLAIYTDVPATQFVCATTVIGAAGYSVSTPASYWPPIELPEGWSIRVSSSAAGLTASGSIFGWIE